MSKTITLTLLAMTISILAYAQNAAPPAKPSAGKPLYTVVDGNMVDPNTLEGWHTWRAMDCERCHGAQQQGLVGPSLVDGLKKLTKEQFEQTVAERPPGHDYAELQGIKNGDGTH